jgi:mitochondrial fission protein ELM1
MFNNLLVVPGPDPYFGGDALALGAHHHTLLILSDGKPGHLGQSVACARLLGLDYTVCRVGFPSRWAKMASYPLDRLGIHTPALFTLYDPLPADCCAVVSAGSSTYYANRTIARQLGVPAVAIMYPGGYGPGFDLIVAQEHDRPPVRENLLAIPVNLAAPVPAGHVSRVGDGPVVAVVIGGPSRHFRMTATEMQRQLAALFSLFPGGDFLLTTSRRTPAEVEAVAESLPFRYRVIASRDGVNPIPDFLAIADYLFVTEDSTSMISEAVSFGAAAVEVLPLAPTGMRNKVRGMTVTLASGGYLHRFDGTLGGCRRKLDLGSLLKERFPCA